MRIPLAKYGVRELLVWGGVLVAGLLVTAVAAGWPALAFVPPLGFLLWFFRDPERSVPLEAGILVAPADGRVVEVTSVEEPLFIRAQAHKVAIFMSPLDVHVNRSPCTGRVRCVEHRPGRYRVASAPAASSENESNWLGLVTEDADTPVLVRQVAGALARRIVCTAQPGDRLDRGQRFGMIKFGSRAEVYVPVSTGFEVLVRLGDRVRAGQTVLGRFP